MLGIRVVEIDKGHVRMEIAFREELPYSPTGKLLRRVLRDELSEPG